ncbi:MAG: putative glycolipid-binding domain-containing protein [Pseudonocardiaceae bacterium]
MSTPRTGEKQAGERLAGGNVPGGTVPRRAHTTRMLSWVGVDCQRLEAARIVLGERGVRATGSMVACQQEGVETHSTSYSLATDELGVVQRLAVRTTRAKGEQHVTITRSEEGIWLVDHGQNAARTTFGGALDVDLAFSPLFNALPVRRLGLHRSTGRHELPMVFVALPSLEVIRVSQTYRTVSLGEAGEPAVIGISSESGEPGEPFEAEFTVDTDGLVVDYPGLAHRG